MVPIVLAVAAGLLGLLVGVLLARLLGRRPGAAAAAGPAGAAGGSGARHRSGGARLGSGATDVLDALHGATVVVDRDDSVVRASPMAHLLGLVQAEQLAHPEVASAIRTVRLRGDHRSLELSVDRGRTGGGVRELSLQVVPLADQMVLVTAEDVTEARRLDAVRRDFVANVSHELKTPVGALALLAEAVEGAVDDPEAVLRFAGRIQHESARLTELVNELIELSRLQDTGQPMHFVRLSVDGLLHEAVEATQTLARASRIDVDLGEPTGIELSGDRTLLLSALRNLITNAIAYSPEGTRVAVGARRAADGSVEISITDQGIGIPVEVQERIFERFYRVDPARSRQTGGTGLGLSIVKHVAARHDGEVTLWSVEGSGSTFTLHLPGEIVE